MSARVPGPFEIENLAAMRVAWAEGARIMREHLEREAAMSPLSRTLVGR